MMDCKEALPLLHAYLDGDLSSDQSDILKEHLQGCEDCRKRLRQYEKAEAMIQAWSPVSVPGYLTERIMNSLPAGKKEHLWSRWIRNHPALSAAAVFGIVMFSSFLATWNNDQVLLVKGDDLQSVIIQGNTVYVPKDHVVAGDLTIENGSLVVEGEVEGNIVVIDGAVNLASTAHISGEIEEIDEAFSWLWFKMNNWISQVSNEK